MHLLNEVLPAATSCASAADAAAEEAITINALRVSFFMGLLFVGFGERRRQCRRRCGMGGSPWTSRNGFLGCSILRFTLVMFGIPDRSLFGELPKRVQTCLICHDKSVSAARLRCRLAVGKKHR